ncbi:MAG TPA: endo-1,4-beta-xylanase, partial [Steroidobacteraceae bacterium]|nr:endo-1,4-beta-xylanase [Steroidobacteraceae bacterium]
MISRRTILQGIGAGALLAQVSSNALAAAMKRTGLKDYYAKDFKIGAAVGSDILHGDKELEGILVREFSSTTPENCLKWEPVHPNADTWNWADADTYVDIGTRNHMYVVGHCLAWHSQVPNSVFKNASGDYVSADELKKKMTDHISTVVGRYKSRINAWDAVNEAIGDEPGNPMRKSHYFNILGEQFIDHAFHVAHEVDPAVHLMYNDYGTERTGKREACVALLKRLKDRGVPVQGVGIQAHLHIDEPSVDEIEKSIVDFAALGLRVHFTELDIDVLPNVWKIPVADIS